MHNLIKKLVGDKRDWHEYQARVEKLPPDFRRAMMAIQKYLFNWAKGAGMMGVVKEVLEMFEEAAAEGATVESVVGEDIAEFADELLREYPEETWIDKQRRQLREEARGDQK